jgi:ATP-dependent Clp protease, protease subunit
MTTSSANFRGMSDSEQPNAEGQSLDTLAVASQRLFQARTVLAFGDVTPRLAERVSAQLLALSALSREPILLFLNSPGGHVESGDTIHDVIRFIEPEVTIVGSGWVASAGALIFCAVERRLRVALPNTRFMLHEPSGGVGGPAADVEIEVRQVLAMRARLHAIFARATGQSVEKIARDTQRNHWLTTDEALEYGLLGRVVERVSEL